MAEIGVGMLGYAFMGKAHSHAFRELAYLAWPPPLVPRLVRIAGRNEQAVGEAAQRYGYAYSTAHRRDLDADARTRRFGNGWPHAPHAPGADASRPARK